MGIGGLQMLWDSDDDTMILLPMKIKIKKDIITIIRKQSDTSSQPHSDLTPSVAWRSRTSAQRGTPNSCLCHGGGFWTPLERATSGRAGLELGFGSEVASARRTTDGSYSLMTLQCIPGGGDGTMFDGSMSLAVSAEALMGHSTNL